MNAKIISKINKLMALTSSSNKHESAKAAEMAFKLMEENGITAKDLDIANLENDLGTIDNEVLKAKTKLTIWEKQLAQVIANYFDCISYIQTQMHPTRWDWKVYAIGFVGHEANRITSITMYEWLRKAIAREANQKFTDNALRQSFCIGVVQGIMNKYDVKQKENKNEVGLVIYDEVQNWIDENMNMGKAKKSRVPSVYSGAYASGVKSADNYSLNKQFGLKAIGC